MSSSYREDVVDYSQEELSRKQKTVKNLALMIASCLMKEMVYSIYSGH